MSIRNKIIVSFLKKRYELKTNNVYTFDDFYIFIKKDLYIHNPGYKLPDERSSCNYDEVSRWLRLYGNARIKCNIDKLSEQEIDIMTVSPNRTLV